MCVFEYNKSGTHFELCQTSVVARCLRAMVKCMEFFTFEMPCIKVTNRNDMGGDEIISWQA